MQRIYIEKLEENKDAVISGFVEKLRDTKYMVFIVLKDITGTIQVSIEKENNEKLITTALNAPIGSVIKVTGKMQLSEYVKNGGKEFIPSHIDIISVAAPSKIEDNANIDTRLDYRFIDLRTNRNTAIFKVQSAMVKYMRDYLYDHNFMEIHTPRLIATASESGSEVFEVKYFDRKAYLAQSPQFYKQMAMSSGFDRIFEVGPCFRAENSNTNRHTTEFTSFDVEFSYIDSFEDVMHLEEEMLTYALTNLKETHGSMIKELFNQEIIVPNGKFPRIKLNDLYDILEEKYHYVPSDRYDLTTEAEKLAGKYALEEYNSEFIFVTGFPAEKRAFYHMRDENGELLGYDLLWKGVEITTGAQREHRYDILKQQALEKGLDKDVEFYLEFFKYGVPTHGGFGLGIDRITMLLLGIETIKEAMFLFRGPNRLNP